jgi:Competence protein CoiA-like family
MRRRTRARHGGGERGRGAPAGAARPERPGRAGAAGVQLAWAHDRDGVKVNARRLDPRDRRSRAPFTCLACAEELVPHLGAVRAPHFAHRAGSTCALTAPETALHLDAKERLLGLCGEAFAGRSVTLLARCPACRRLAPRAIAAEGDGAVPEGAVGALRADVLVTAGGRPSLAIEVVVTHALDAGKEAALAAAGVPAVEVDAREEWEREGEAGVEVVCARSLGFPACAACAAHARAERDRLQGGEAAEIAELEVYRARGLLGPAPAAARRSSTGATDGDAPFAPAERDALAARFACPDCTGRALELGSRLAHHACPDGTRRPVAWRGYDGTTVELSWWRRERRGTR